MTEAIIARLTSKDDKCACAFADQIISESRETDTWYAYLDVFASLLDDPKSLVRNRRCISSRRMPGGTRKTVST